MFSVYSEYAVITTNYSAHTEFCNNDNSFLINIEEKELAYDGKWFNGQGEWAKLGGAQISKFIEGMRMCYENRPSNIKGQQTGKRFSWENTVDKLIGVLNTDNIVVY